MAIIYLDVDDEITSAASRMRAVSESRVALVLPGGSRLGTSRINFRLLAREAQTSARTLAIVCPEPSTRALAASAGLPVFGSVLEYEAAAAAPEGKDVPTAGVAAVALGIGEEASAVAPGAVEATGAAAGVAGLAAGAAEPAGPEIPPVTPTSLPLEAPLQSESAGTQVAEAATTGGGASPARPPTMLPVVRGAGRRGRPRTRLLVGLVVIGLVVLVGAVAAWIVLPSASVDVVVRPEPLDEVDLTVIADPTATATDSVAGVVTAERPTFELAASSTFPATGKKVEETKATGVVRWQNCDPTTSYRIPQAAVVRTPGGVRFTTDETVFLPVALLSGNPPTITCQTRDVGVTAARAGEAGNVAAGTITVVPTEYNSVVVRVANPAPTSGGSRTTTPLVTRKDVDAATKALNAALDDQLDAALTDPAQVPAGRVLFDDTKSRTNSVPTVDPTGLVDQEGESFELGLTSTGSVTAVDLNAVRSIAERRLLATVPAGYSLVDGSVHVDLGEPSVAAETVSFPVAASADIVRQVSEAEVREAIAGLRLDEAEAALSRFGEATITVWPDWTTTIPTYDLRLAVSVRTELPEASPEASPTASTPP